MAHHSIKAVQNIPAGLTETWQFFTSPDNLVRITPAAFSFRIISQHHGNNIYQGQIIEYKVSPLFSIPWYWMTEITHVLPMTFFVDEQRYGPFRMWHHQHHFEEVQGGVKMTDIVHYSIPGWWFGRMVNAVMVRKRLEGLFRFRFAQIEKIFGKWPEDGQCELRVY